MPITDAQFETTISALEPALAHKKARLHVYLPVDPELMKVSLGNAAHDHKKLIEDTYRFIKNAAAMGAEIEFSPEGYSRMAKNFDFVSDVIRAAITAGATIINCPDTIGGGCKLQGDDYFVKKMQQHAALMCREFPHKNITWSTHCHNDFNLKKSKLFQIFYIKICCPANLIGPSRVKMLQNIVLVGILMRS